MLITWGICKLLGVLGNLPKKFHKSGWGKKENGLFILFLWFFHLAIWMVIWMVPDQIGTTNVGTRQEEIEFLNVCQKRKTMNVKSIILKIKDIIPNSLIIIIIKKLRLKSLTKFSGSLRWPYIPLKRTNNIFNNTFWKCSSGRIPSTFIMS